MKKLMTAFAVCALAGLVSAVESLNIVGYQTINLPQGYKMTTSTFVPVGSDGKSLRLGDITPINFDGANGDTVQLFNSNGNGNVNHIYTYYAGYGWYNPDTDSNVDAELIPTGTGMFVYASLANAQFQVAGEVALQSLALAVPAGYTVVGNSSPKAITLGAVVPANFDGANGDTAQFFNSNGNGNVNHLYTFYAGYGWYNPDTDSNVDAEVLNPGDAFFAYASQSNASFTFPAVL